jgi:protein ImuB
VFTDALYQITQLTNYQMGFAAIYVPDFAVEAILRAEPELREHAVAVVEGAPPLVHVIAVNEKAAAAGVEPGMTKLQAAERFVALSSACATSIRQRSAPHEAAAHAALLDGACGFSPRVEDTAPDTVLLDLAGLERIFGPPGKIARDVARRCSDLGLEANVAVACNADAAMHAARGFPGVTVIPAGEEAQRLGSLPIEVLASGQWSVASGQENRQSAVDNRQFLEMLDTLDRWGVRTLRALAALPEIAVTERLGQEGLRWQKLARGATSRPLVPIEPPLTFEESMELEYPVAELEPLSFLLNRMLEQLCARLAARALAANEVTLRMQLDLTCGGDRAIGSSGHRMIETATSAPITRSPDHPIARSLRLPVPMLDAKVFLKLLQLDLQTNPPGAPVMKVWLSATPAEPRRAQDGLFLPAAPEAERLEVTLSKIKRVVSRMPSADGHRPSTIDQRQNPQSAIDNRQCSSTDHVGSPELIDTHQPDAFRMTKFAPAMVGGQSSVAGSQQNRQSAIDNRQWDVARVSDPRHTVTALRVFRPPLAASVVLIDGRPARLACPERPTLRGDVTWCAGPWRSSGEWWSEQAWSREEWDIALDGALYRVYRDPNGWFVEGSYD